MIIHNNKINISVIFLKLQRGSIIYTYPPPNYAPASPYCTLTKSFYRLVKEKIITTRLLKTLLYSEFLKCIDTSEVKRRQHKTEFKIKTDSDYDNCDSSDSDSEKRLCRQNAVDTESDTDGTETNSFGFIRYFNSSEDHLESFIDHGEEKDVKNEVAVVEKVTLAVCQQISGESGSSFENTKPYMACEDLVNIDENIEIALLNTNKFILKSRHSLPTKFVGNKFNKNSMTLVNIPHWSNSENNIFKSSSKSNDSSSSSETTTTHSSCLDLPVNTIPVPDTIVAEILYNFEPEDDKTVYKPPTLFRNESKNKNVETNETNSNLELNLLEKGTKKDSYSPEKIKKSSSLDTPNIIDNSIEKKFTRTLNTDTNLNLSLTNISFKNHSFNSDKPKKYTKDNLEESDKKLVAKVTSKKRVKNTVLPIEKTEKTVLPQEKRRSSDEIILVLPDLENPFENLHTSLEDQDMVTFENISLNRDSNELFLHRDSLEELRKRFGYEEDNFERFLQLNKEQNDLLTQYKKESDIFKRRSSLDESDKRCGIVLPSRENLAMLPHEEPRREKRKANSLRKCVSYHYLQIGRKPSCTFSYCRCCTEPCFSRRSSDSGMAGSCTLNSPDIPQTEVYQREVYSLLDNFRTSDMDAREFEAQCRCTSPFGSTPRTSCQASTSENIIETRDSSSASVTSSCSDMSPFPPQPWESEIQIHEKIQSVKQKTFPSCSKSKSCDDIQERNEVFRSGLYAHWWMKAKLPWEVVKGIAEETAGKGECFELLHACFILHFFPLPATPLLITVFEMMYLQVSNKLSTKLYTHKFLTSQL